MTFHRQHDEDALNPDTWPWWVRIIAVVTLAFLIGVGMTQFAFGQNLMHCLPHEAAVERLKNDYGEEPLGLGVAPQGTSVVALFLNQTTGTWTVLATRVNGISCVVASGNHWQFHKGIKIVKEAPV